MAFAFLTARWTDICLLTYAVPPSMLEKRLAPGLSLDLREGRAFVSLVAFNFLDTRVLGVPWPGYRNFAELNLRFYVRLGEQRGVQFIREFVPQWLVATLARTIYNEPYLTTPIHHDVQEDDQQIAAECRLLWGGQTHTLRVTGRKPAFCPPEDSDEHFFKEHQWGFGVDRKGRLTRYEVQHPRWLVYPVVSHHVDLDFVRVYGPDWGWLQDQEPCSVALAAGSAVKVFPKGRLGA